MKYFHFNYYDKFHCINKDCSHTCCALWDISVDKAAAKRYKENGVLSEGVNYDTFCYKKQSNGHCMFLDDDNLCRIIKEYGEKAISKTCKVHPRFKNFFSDRTETGLGLCCEEAVRLLFSEEDIYFIKTGEKGKNKDNSPFEKKVISFREELINSVKCSDKPLYLLIEELSEKIGYKKESQEETLKTLNSLERLDKEWDKYLSFIPKAKNMTEKYDKELKKVLIYFILRHVSGAFDLTDLYVRAAFSLFSVRALIFIISGKMKNDGDCTLKDVSEIVRGYSAETEYSEENLFSLYERAEERLDFLRINKLKN